MFRSLHSVKGALLSGLLLMLADCAFALDPDLSLAQLIHTSWNGTAGFAVPGVWALAQTSDGYLWLGTEQGLIRFDGIRFVRWQSPEGEELAGASVTSLASSRNGGLWIGMAGAILRVQRGHVERYSVRDGLPAGPIVTMVEDRTGRLWAGCPAAKGGLIRIENRTVTVFGKGHGLPNSQVLSLFLDHDDSLFVGTYGGFCQWNGNAAEACRITPEGFDIDSIAKGPEGQTLIAGSTRGLLRFDGEGPQPAGDDAERAMKVVKALWRDRDSTLWVGTVGQGLFRIRKGHVEHLTRVDGLSSDVIRSL